MTEDWKFKESVLEAMTDVFSRELRKWFRKMRPVNKKVGLLRPLGIRRLARLTCQSVLEHVYGEMVYRDLARAIGRRCELLFHQQAQNDPKAWMKRYERLALVVGRGKAQRAKFHDAKEPWWPQAQIRVGMVLLCLLRDRTMFITIGRSPGRKKKNMVSVHPDVIEMIRKKREVFVDPDKWLEPTARPPAKWQRRNSSKLNRSLIGNKEPFDAPEVFDAVNHLQATPWRINQRVLEVMTEVFEGGYAIGMPSSEQPVLPRDGGSRVWSRVQTQRFEWHRERMRFARTLARAVTLPEKFFFRWTADFRGRLYPHGGAVSPQAHSDGRSLLEFHHGEPIGKHADQLALFGSSMWGLRRKTFEERVAWVVENEENILSSANMPTEFTWWTKAEEPWRFLAFCFEFEGWRKNGPAHVSHLPCQVDGTCNGLQILALVLGDVELAKRVNCADSDRPKDLYSEVAEQLSPLLEDRGGWGRDWAELCNGKLPRSLVKRAVITLTFGGSTWAVKTAIESWFWRQDFDGLPFRGEVANPSHWLAIQLDRHLNELVPQFATIRKWMGKVCRHVGVNQKDLEWRTPTGWPIVCDYRKFKVKKFTDLLYGRVKTPMVSTYEVTDDKNMRKVIQTVLPNLIQSLDASALHRAVNKCAFPLLAAHDCFGTWPSRMRELNRHVRDAYAEIFSADPLTDFARQVGAARIPDIRTGTFPAALVRQSRYFLT